MLSAFCFLLSAYCFLLSAFCFLLSAFCFLLSAFCFLLLWWTLVRGARVQEKLCELHFAVGCAGYNIGCNLINSGVNRASSVYCRQLIALFEHLLRTVARRDCSWYPDTDVVFLEKTTCSIKLQNPILFSLATHHQEKYMRTKRARTHRHSRPSGRDTVTTTNLMSVKT